MSNSYLFRSERLGFRNWRAADLPTFFQINSEDAVMEYFPAKPTLLQTESFILRMQEMFARAGFCYFAVERLDTCEFIGFIGLSEQNYDAEFCPCIDIGWRLGSAHWNLGFATEGARACVEYGHKELGIQQIMAIASIVNHKSIRIMEKIGMQELVTFRHPALHDNARLIDCVCYVSK
jgi:RimJ/RimL family protein N-acetyltransferase